MIDFTRIRLYLVALVFLLGFGTLLLRLWNVQVNRHKEFTERVPGTTTATVRIPGNRGAILDRHGNTYARNRNVFELRLNLKDIVNGYKKKHGNLPKKKYRNREETDIVSIVNDTVYKPLVEQLKLPISYSSRDLEIHYRSTRGLVPFLLSVDMPFEQFCVVAEHTLEIGGVHVEGGAVREYPYGAMFAHSLGYVGRPNQEAQRELLQAHVALGGERARRAEAELNRYDYYVPDPLGKTGLESHLDEYLRGRPGLRTHLRNEKGVYVRELVSEPPRAGSDVYLTIDTEIQYLVEKALREAGVGIGAAVVIDPRNGEILAMASVPSYDPNLFIPSISRTDWDKIANDPTHPLINRSITDFAPGSVFKLAVSTAASLSGLPIKSYYCGGSVKYPGAKPMGCWLRTGHATVGLQRAIKVSCNCYYYQLGNNVGIENVVAACNLLGLGRRTGIPVSREQSGRIPTPQYYQGLKPPQKWSKGLMAQVSIGQGATEATPLQIANLAATVANGGICYKPRLVHRIVQPDEGSVEERKPVILHDLREAGVSERDINRMRNGMRDVVNAHGGTAPRARLNDIVVAGKTGTAQFFHQGKLDNHAWFMGFAPYEEPTLAVSVFIYRGKGGGKVAAPIARTIIDQTLNRQRPRRKFPEILMAEAPGSYDSLTEVELTGENLLDVEDIDTAVVIHDAYTGSQNDSTVRSPEENPTIRGEADVRPDRINP